MHKEEHGILVILLSSVCIWIIVSAILIALLKQYQLNSWIYFGSAIAAGGFGGWCYFVHLLKDFIMNVEKTTMEIVTLDKPHLSDEPIRAEPPAGTEFEHCVKCGDQTETDHLDKFGRCPTCGEASPLRLVEFKNVS